MLRKSATDLRSNLRESMSAILGQQLADLLEFRGQLYQAHWNIRGPHFIMLHKLFDDMGSDIEAAIDDVAERITAIGGFAHGTARSVAAHTKLPTLKEQATGESDLLNALQASLAHLASQARTSIDEADKAGDKDTADLFTGLSRDIDKKLWFIEAHLEPFQPA